MSNASCISRILDSYVNTPAHLLIGAALFSKHSNRALLGGALLGGLLPDLSLYLMAGYALFVLQLSTDVVFGQLYFSDTWQLVFSIDNSFVIWGVACALAVKIKRPFFIALSSAAVLHLLCDFTLHNDDARAHFWPITDWRFFSPVSYWDNNHHAAYVAPLEGLLASVAAVYLLSSKYHFAIKACLGLLLLAEIIAVTGWYHYL